MRAAPNAGPKGGRLLEARPLRAEFFVNPDRRVEIAFYDESLAVVPPGEQVLRVIAELPGDRRVLELEMTATGFVSADALPPGEGYRVVVQIREAAGARPQNFRIDLRLEKCAGCARGEYACTCEGH